MILSSQQLVDAFGLIKRVQLPLLRSVDALPPGVSVAHRIHRADEARHALKTSDQVFRRLRPADWDELVAAGLVELVVETERRYRDPEFGSQPPEDVRVTYVLLTDAGREAWPMVDPAPLEEFWARRREQIAAHAPITPYGVRG